MGGGGQTSTTTSQQGPPQLITAGAPGYQQAQSFYRSILENPPVYGGPRVAPLDPRQQQALGQAGPVFGVSPTDVAARQQLYDTLSGGYLQGPQIQSAVSSAAQPLFQQFQQQVLPGIRDRAQLTGQGSGATRRDVATGEATTNLGQSLATGVVAPIVEAERANQLAAVRESTVPATTGLLEQQGLLGAGQVGQQQQQSLLDAAKALFEEPMFRQSQAAQALFGAAGAGGGSGLTQTSGSATPSTAAKAGQAAGIAVPLGIAAVSLLT